MHYETFVRDLKTNELNIAGLIFTSVLFVTFGLIYCSGGAAFLPIIMFGALAATIALGELRYNKKLHEKWFKHANEGTIWT